jgi:hypothetical protein
MTVPATLENGTCATIFPLVDAKPEDMRAADLNTSVDNAPELTINDILHTANESELFRRDLVHTILRILLNYGGSELFRSKFAEALALHEPHSDILVPLCKTLLQNLPAMHIDQSTITGNSEVVEAIDEETGIRNSPNFLDFVRILAGDQLSLARLRALVSIRAGHEGGYTGFGWAVFMPGLFHGKLADMRGLFLTHYGRASLSNSGSLAWHNSVLNRNPILLSSLPPFRTCRDLAFVSLYARVLHCFQKVSGCQSLDEYAEKDSSFSELEKHAQHVLDEYASGRVVAKMRQARSRGCPQDGDVHFENGALFLRDALVSRALADAIKCGDSGRVVVVLKWLALAYRGNGCTKYAYEMLHLIHNLTHVWPKPLRCDSLFIGSTQCLHGVRCTG